MIEDLNALWAILVALPGEVWLNSLYLFIAISLAKAVGVVRNDGWAAGANVYLSIIMNGGWESIAGLNAALSVSATAVIAAIYYLIWKKYVSGLVGDMIDGIKAKIPSKA